MSKQSGEVEDIPAREAFDLLTKETGARLVDVRTRAEWAFVGIPDLSESDKEVILLEWQSFPTMTANPEFTARLAETLIQQGAKPDDPLLFLCRSGARSHAAAVAMAERGYTRCLNVAGGFEGPPDGDRHRGHVDGWKAQGLPWQQS